MCIYYVISLYFIYVGGYSFHSAFDIFKEFFGDDDPFKGMFGGPMFSDFGMFGGTCSYI